MDKRESSSQGQAKVRAFVFLLPIQPRAAAPLPSLVLQIASKNLSPTRCASWSFAPQFINRRDDFYSKHFYLITILPPPSLFKMNVTRETYLKPFHDSMLMSPLARVNNCKVTLSASCKRVTVVSKNLYGVSSSFFLFFSFFEEFIVLYDRANNPVSCSRSSSYRNNTKFSLAETCWNYPECGRFSFKIRVRAE